jgi:hypothetical protein
MKTWYLLMVERYDFGAEKSAISPRRRKEAPRDMRHRRPGIDCEHRWFETREQAEKALTERRRQL